MGPPVPGGAGFYYTARAARLSSGAWHVRVAHGAAEAAPNEPPLPPHHPESRLPRLPSPRRSRPSSSTSPRSRSPNPSVGSRRACLRRSPSARGQPPGVWLGGARPGDVLEIVSDDRAFDAVGDVASTLGVSFKRLSYRALIGAHAAVLPAEREMPDSRGRSRRGRRGRGGRPRHRPPQLAPAPVAPVERLPIREAPADESAHSAPHDEIVGVVRELLERASDHSA